MGNDGGSIPKRRELVKSAARGLSVSELKANTLESLGHAWTHDPLNTTPLDIGNAVSDWRGRLYNYETIIQSLMPDGEPVSETPPDSPGLTFAATGIKSLRDVVKLKFSRSSDKSKDAPVCPVSMKELGPSTRAVYLVPCGHAFAEVAIKQIQEDICPECSEQFERRNVVSILPVDQVVVEKLARRIETLKAEGLTHSLKKNKSAAAGKKKRKAHGAPNGGEDKKHRGADEKRRATEEGVKGAKGEVSSATKLGGINNALAASLTAKVLAEQEELSKQRKLTAKA